MGAKTAAVWVLWFWGEGTCNCHWGATAPCQATCRLVLPPGMERVTGNWVKISPSSEEKKKKAFQVPATLVKAEQSCAGMKTHCPEVMEGAASGRHVCRIGSSAANSTLLSLSTGLSCGQSWRVTKNVWLDWGIDWVTVFKPDVSWNGPRKTFFVAWERDMSCGQGPRQWLRDFSHISYVTLE